MLVYWKVYVDNHPKTKYGNSEEHTDKILGLASNSPKNRNMFLIESPIYQWENNNHLQQIEVCWFCVKSICPPVTQHSYGR